jgi:hypothetical protein
MLISFKVDGLPPRKNGDWLRKGKPSEGEA